MLLRLLWVSVACCSVVAAARAQPCVTCRSEQCPDKADATEWCGAGRDPRSAHPEPRAPDQISGLRIESAPPGAQVRLGSAEGQLLGNTPVKGLHLRAGTHTLFFRRDGYLARSLEVEVRRRNELFAVELTQAASLSVACNIEGAKLFLDGNSVGVTPMTLPDLSVGPHVVEVHQAGRQPARQELVVKPGGNAIFVTLLPATATPTPVPPPPDQAPCSVGQLVTPDTAGRCCWPGQAWSDERCVGIPTSCPPGFFLDRAAQRCTAPTCANGRLRAQDGLHCCWPGQAWSNSRGRCIGIPSCPDGWSARPDLALGGAEECIENPSLYRNPQGDGEQCRASVHPGYPRAFLCDIRGYHIRGRADATAEEIAEIRGKFHRAGRAICETLGRGAGCVFHGAFNGSQDAWCCP